MSRNELILYLKDLRDLEITREWIKRQKAWEKEYYSDKIRHMDDDLPLCKAMRNKKDVYKSLLEAIIIFGGILGFGILLVYLCMLGLSAPSFAFLQQFLMLLTGVGLIIIILGGKWLITDVSVCFKDLKDLRAYNNDVIMHNEKVEEYRINNKNAKQSMIRKVEKLCEYWNGEEDMVDEILFNLYTSINIIPKPHRNISSMIYIYDYMSTSTVSLEQTLISADIEKGIKIIEGKLDDIIDQNADIIMNQRRQEQIIEQSNRSNRQILNDMHSSINNIENYTSISACHNAVNTFFLVADWIDKQ